MNTVMWLKNPDSSKQILNFYYFWEHKLFPEIKTEFAQVLDKEWSDNGVGMYPVSLPKGEIMAFMFHGCFI